MGGNSIDEFLNHRTDSDTIHQQQDYTIQKWVSITGVWFESFLFSSVAVHRNCRVKQSAKVIVISKWMWTPSPISVNSSVMISSRCSIKHVNGNFKRQSMNWFIRNARIWEVWRSWNAASETRWNIFPAWVQWNSIASLEISINWSICTVGQPFLIDSSWHLSSFQPNSNTHFVNTVKKPPIMLFEPSAISSFALYARALRGHISTSIFTL